MDKVTSSQFELLRECRNNYFDDFMDLPNSFGKMQYLRHLCGEKLSLQQAIIAKCFQSCGYYSRCDDFRCPLFEYCFNEEE